MKHQIVHRNRLIQSYTASLCYQLWILSKKAELRIDGLYLYRVKKEIPLRNQIGA